MSTMKQFKLRGEDNKPTLSAFLSLSTSRSW